MSESARGSDTRARLLEAAVTAFAERGFHGTSTRDIASAAGMSPAAVYVHYRSKEELLDQIARTGHEQVVALIRDATTTYDSPADQLSGAVRDFAAHHAHAHAAARVVNYELAALTPDNAGAVRDLRRQISAGLREIVERGIADGSFDCPDPRLAATALLSLGIDIARWYREDHSLTPEELGDAYAALALRMVGARVT